MYDILFSLYYLFIKYSVANKIVEDRVDNIPSKNSDGIKVDQSPWGEF